jgi:hypothetical protein
MVLPSAVFCANSLVWSDATELQEQMPRQIWHRPRFSGLLLLSSSAGTIFVVTFSRLMLSGVLAYQNRHAITEPNGGKRYGA